MNKRMKNKKNKKIIDASEQLIIDVSKRSNIQIKEMPCYGEDLERLRKELDEISKIIEETYYSSSSAIDRVQKRNFFDLFKIFVTSIMFEKEEKKKKVREDG